MNAVFSRFSFVLLVLLLAMPLGAVPPHATNPHTAPMPVVDLETDATTLVWLNVQRFNPETQQFELYTFPLNAEDFTFKTPHEIVSWNHFRRQNWDAAALATLLNQPQVLPLHGDFRMMVEDPQPGNPGSDPQGGGGDQDPGSANPSSQEAAPGETGEPLPGDPPPADPINP